jgi:UDP-2,3-diacylglucosamine pyrophosphatase LpxH
MPVRPLVLYVISDLHLGGRVGVPPARGFRINTHVPLLSEFIHRLAVRAADTRAASRLELVINGDIVDFLAQEGPQPDQPWRAFIEDPAEALQAYVEIRDQERPFFDALRELLHQGGDLTLLLGNHDVELSLPAVRARIEADLGAADSRGRLRWIVDGQAHAVGDVLIEHGNRYDGFNVIDHDRLRRVRSAQSRRQRVPDGDGFEPPPGSRLVQQVMNPIKRDYPFVDLLKPETEAVVPLLIALEPGLAADIERLWTLWRLKAEAGRQQPTEPAQPVHAGQIGITPPATAAAGPQDALAQMLAGRLPGAQLAALQQLAQGAAMPAQSPIGLGDGLGNAWRRVGSLLRERFDAATWDRRLQVLLDALRTLQHDTSFDPAVEQPAWLRPAQALADGGFRVVVFGHTHLAKQVPLAGGAVYLNTGTWADLMKLPAGLFAADRAHARAALDRFVDDLRGGRHDDHLAFDPRFARCAIDEAGRCTDARLCRFDAGAGLD